MGRNLICPFVDCRPVPQIPKLAAGEPEQHPERCRHLACLVDAGEEFVASKWNFFDQDFCQTFLLQCRAAPANGLRQRIRHPYTEGPDGPTGQLAGVVFEEQQSRGQPGLVVDALPTTTAS